LFLLILF
jgi:hypothetical protein